MNILSFVLFTIVTIVIIILLTQCYTTSCALDNALKSLTVQTARWSVASLQDQNPLVANLHANYGVAYVMALRDIASDQEIKRATGIDAMRLYKSVINAQRKATQSLLKACPNIIPMEDPYLTRISQSQS